MREFDNTVRLLESYKTSFNRIDALKTQIASIEQLMKYIDKPRYFGEQRLKPMQGPKRETLEKMLTRLYEECAELSQKLNTCEALINSAQPPQAADVLSCYYIGGMTMEDVATICTNSALEYENGGGWGHNGLSYYFEDVDDGVATSIYIDAAYE